MKNDGVALPAKRRRARGRLRLGRSPPQSGQLRDLALAMVWLWSADKRDALSDERPVAESDPKLARLMRETAQAIERLLAHVAMRQRNYFKVDAGAFILAKVYKEVRNGELDGEALDERVRDVWRGVTMSELDADTLSVLTPSAAQIVELGGPVQAAAELVGRAIGLVSRRSVQAIRTFDNPVIDYSFCAERRTMTSLLGKALLLRSFATGVLGLTLDEAARLLVRGAGKAAPHEGRVTSDRRRA